MTHDRGVLVRTVKLSGYALSVGWFGVGSALSIDRMWEGPSWWIAISGFLLIGCGQFMLGMWEGPKEPDAPQRDPRPPPSWWLVIVGSGLLLLAFIRGLSMTDHKAMPHALGFLIPGAVLLTWGLYRPRWLFLKDAELDVQAPPEDADGQPESRA